ncbi:hypothetical protein ABPG73_022949 [Tetrahymena malaccensis]
MEQIASPLIAKSLKCRCSLEVKALIHQKIDLNKPKYMGIIDQYFYYINKFNLNDLFLNQLNQIISNPIDLTGYQKQQSYNEQKIIRKQFVCYLILRFFELYGKQQISSFYELWNICFPQEIQIKKKLSKYDFKREENTNLKGKTSDHKFKSITNTKNKQNFSFKKKQQQKTNLGDCLIQTIQNNDQLYQNQVKIEENTQINCEFDKNQLNIVKQEEYSHNKNIIVNNMIRPQINLERNKQGKYLTNKSISYSYLQEMQNNQIQSEQRLSTSHSNQSQIQFKDDYYIINSINPINSLNDIQNSQNQQKIQDQSKQRVNDINLPEIKVEENHYRNNNIGIWMQLRDMQNIQSQEESYNQNNFRQYFSCQSEMKQEEKIDVYSSLDNQINKQNLEISLSTQFYSDYAQNNLQEIKQIQTNTNINLDFPNDTQILDIQNQKIYSYHRPQIEFSLNLYQLKFEENSSNNNYIYTPYNKSLGYQNLNVSSKQIMNNDSIDNSSQIKFEDIRNNSKKKQEINNNIFEDGEEVYDNFLKQEQEYILNTEGNIYQQFQFQKQEYHSQ